MFLQVAEDRDAARARNPELRAHRYISRTGGRSSHRSKDVVISCKRRWISDTVCRDVLQPLAGLRIDYTQLGYAGRIHSGYIESVVAGVVPNLIATRDLRDGVDEAAIDCIQDIGYAAADRE